VILVTGSSAVDVEDENLLDATKVASHGAKTKVSRFPLVTFNVVITVRLLNILRELKSRLFLSIEYPAIDYRSIVTVRRIFFHDRARRRSTVLARLIASAMPVSSLGTVPSSFRRTSVNDRSDEILMWSTAIVCDVTETCVVAWAMSHSHCLSLFIQATSVQIL
jgi:hypothetical protein